MSSSEFSAWLAFYRLEPFGEVRADFRAGLVCSTIANLVRDSKAKALTPADFMPLVEDLAPPKKKPLSAHERDQANREFIAALKTVGKRPQLP